QPKLTQGSWVRDGGVVVEAAFADALGIEVGDSITLKGRTFRVVGIAVTAAAPPYPDACLGFCGPKPGDAGPARVPPAGERGPPPAPPRPRPPALASAGPSPVTRGSPGSPERMSAASPPQDRCPMPPTSSWPTRQRPGRWRPTPIAPH